MDVDAHLDIDIGMDVAIDIARHLDLDLCSVRA